MDLNILKNQKFYTDPEKKYYDKEQVDKFLKDVFTIIQEQQQELSILSKKIKKFKKEEDSLKLVLVNSQKMAIKIINDAREAAEEYTEKSKIKSKEFINEAHRISGIEIEKIKRLKKEVEDFKMQILKSYKSHIELIINISENENKTFENFFENFKENVDNLKNNLSFEQININNFKEKDEINSNIEDEKINLKENSNSNIDFSNETEKMNILEDIKGLNQSFDFSNNIENKDEMNNNHNYKSAHNRTNNEKTSENNLDLNDKDKNKNKFDDMVTSDFTII